MKTQIKPILIGVAAVALMTAVLVLLMPIEKKQQQREKYGRLAIQAETDERAKYILDRAEQYPEDILQFYYNGDQFFDFVYNFPEHYNDYASMSYTQEELNSEKPPKLYMDDTRWCYQPMGGGYIVKNGCAAVSLTMAYLKLTGKGDTDPYKIAVEAEKIDAIGFFGGIDVLRIKDVAEAIGLSAEEHTYFDDKFQKTADPTADEIKSIIDSGAVLLAGCKGEVFGDHAIIVTSYSDEGFTINDPADRDNSEKIWTYEELAHEIYAMWGLEARF